MTQPIKVPRCLVTSCKPPAALSNLCPEKVRIKFLGELGTFSILTLCMAQDMNLKLTAGRYVMSKPTVHGICLTFPRRCCFVVSDIYFKKFKLGCNYTYRLT